VDQGIGCFQVYKRVEGKDAGNERMTMKVTYRTTKMMRPAEPTKRAKGTKRAGSREISGWKNVLMR